MLEGGGLHGLASMSELLAMLLQVGLQLGHILALEDVPNCPSSSIPMHTLHKDMREKTKVYALDVTAGA